MEKPIIGLTPSHNTDTDEIRMGAFYLRALRAAGAIPVLLPLQCSEEDLEQLADTLDGFLFTGGPDVHPFLFGEEAHRFCGSVSAKRDRMELALLPAIMKRKKPILGVCRGIQLLNIALGGTIWQDIPSQVTSQFPIAHSQGFDYSLPAHTVAVTPGSKLAAVTGSEKLSVNSMHHQAVKDAAPGILISATAPDGLAEAMELPDYPFFIGVQWHPERLWETDEAAAKLFTAFVNAAKRNS